MNMQKQNGLILKGVGSFYTVLTEGEREVVCRARGRFRRDGLTPSVGDRVTFAEEGDGCRIDAILPRKNILVRPAVANLDKLLIVVAASAPKPDLLLLDKLLIQCEIKGIAPVIVVNKCDEEDDGIAQMLQAQYGGAGYPVLPTSAATGLGVDEVKRQIEGCVCCFAGQSAVGKSSLINALVPSLSLETGVLSKKTERGKHTTRHAQLWRACGGAILDTPGFSLLDAEEMEPERLADYYPEMKGKRDGCRFPECMHRKEPDCSIKKMIGKPGGISQGRYERYQILAEELTEKRKHRYD